jgi:hypothetical protein
LLLDLLMVADISLLSVMVFGVDEYLKKYPENDTEHGGQRCTKRLFVT